MIHEFGSLLMAVPEDVFKWTCAVVAIGCTLLIGRAKPRKMQMAQSKPPIDLYGSYDYFSREGE